MNWMIFAGDCYYPSGGWDDFRARARSLAEALDLAALLKSWDWAHIVDASCDLYIEVEKKDRDKFVGMRPCWMPPLDWKEQAPWVNYFLRVSK